MVWTVHLVGCLNKMKEVVNNWRTNDDWWQYYEGYDGVDGQSQNVLLSFRRIRRGGKLMESKSGDEHSTYTHLWKSLDIVVMTCTLWQLTGPISKLDRSIYRERCTHRNGHKKEPLATKLSLGSTYTISRWQVYGVEIVYHRSTRLIAMGWYRDQVW